MNRNEVKSRERLPDPGVIVSCYNASAGYWNGKRELIGGGDWCQWKNLDTGEAGVRPPIRWKYI